MDVVSVDANGRAFLSLNSSSGKSIKWQLSGYNSNSERTQQIVSYFQRLQDKADHGSALMNTIIDLMIEQRGVYHTVPDTIRVSGQAGSGYKPAGREGLFTLDPVSDANKVYLGVDGKLHNFSLDRIISHEIGHVIAERIIVDPLTGQWSVKPWDSAVKEEYLHDYAPNAIRGEDFRAKHEEPNVLIENLIAKEMGDISAPRKQYLVPREMLEKAHAKASLAENDDVPAWQSNAYTAELSDETLKTVYENNYALSTAKAGASHDSQVTDVARVINAAQHAPEIWDPGFTNRLQVGDSIVDSRYTAFPVNGMYLVSRLTGMGGSNNYEYFHIDLSEARRSIVNYDPFAGTLFLTSDRVAPNIAPTSSEAGIIDLADSLVASNTALQAAIANAKANAAANGGELDDGFCVQFY